MFKVGEVVQLTAGGPSMTVKEVNGTSIKVQWFEGTDLKESTFATSLLKSTLSESQILLG